MKIGQPPHNLNCLSRLGLLLSNSLSRIQRSEKLLDILGQFNHILQTDEVDLVLMNDAPPRFSHRILNTADFYSSILNNLRVAGTPIPTNDIWIAAIAFQHGYTLFSKDHHFSLIPGLVQLGE